MSLISALTTDDALTANGAITNSTTDSKLLDFFANAGSLRNRTESEILRMFNDAYFENPSLALRMLLWVRDCRGGAGERRTFRIIFNSLSPRDKNRIIHKVPEVGRWDDLWKKQANNEVVRTFTPDLLSFLSNNLQNGLLCKWLPRKGKLFDALVKYNRTTPKELRKTLVSNTQVVEQLMSSRRWSEIKYSTVPSKAMSNYARSFSKRDGVRFSEYMQKVEKGEAKINASTLFPYDVLLSLNKNAESVVNAQWNALPNYYSDENILVVADVSGSMGDFRSKTLCPIHASISLAMYTAEKNTGLFKDHFITFSSKPKLQKLSGTFTNRVNQLQQAEWAMSTDLVAVFELLLTKAVKHRLTDQDLPTKIVIVSDMEFNHAVTNISNFNEIKRQYESHGYTIPQLVFWNVNGRAGNVPVKMNDKGVALVSGYSPSIIPSILGESISPMAVMLKTLNVERYNFGS
jgi:hypothetical protein